MQRIIKRNGQEMIVYRLDNKTYMESFERAWNRLSKVFDVKDQSNGSYNKYMDCRNVEIYDTKEGFVPCYRLIRNVQSKWLQVTLQNGRTIRVTDDHPFETENRGVVLARDLMAEDVIRVNDATKAIKTIGTKQIHPDFAWMLGTLLCDECYAGHVSLSLAAEGEDDIAAKFAECANRFFELDTKTIKQDRGPKGIYQDIYLVSDGTYRLQVAMSYLNGIFGGKQKVTRHIPEDILEWSKEAKISWDFDYGKLYTPEMEDEIIQELSHPYYDGLTLLGGRKYMDGVTDQYLDLIDVLVDGPFVEAQKKITLNFRGSSNQRIIDLKETRKTGTIVLDPLNN